MDPSTIAAQIAGLTGDLTPAAGATASQLDAVRKALALYLLNQGTGAATAVLGLPVAPAATPSAELMKELGQLVGNAASSAVGPAPLVFRRSLPAIAIGNPAFVPSAMSGMRGQSVGPFVDTLGAPYWFDIIPALQQTVISWAGDSTPLLSLPLAVPGGTLPTTLTVGAGSLWMYASLLAAAAPSGGYAGVLIKGGTVTFSAAPVATSSGLQIAAGTTVTLTFEPGGTAGPTGQTGPGADGGAAIVNVPPVVTLSFAQTGATLSVVQDASLTAYGTAVTLQWRGASPVYNAAVAQLLVPLQASSATFAIATAQSSLFRPTGAAPVAGAGWALPVAVTPAAQLGGASSAGLLAMQLAPGLKVTCKALSATPQSLGAVMLEATGGMLVLIAQATLAGGTEGTIKLWPNASAGSAYNSELDLQAPPGGTLYYNSVGDFGGTTSTEIAAAAVQISAHIDRPVAADGSRLGPDLPGWAAWYSSPAQNGVLVFGLLPVGWAQPPAPIALALHNALMVTTPPELLLVTGTFGAMPSELQTGGLLLVFGLRTILPILPDPYAANFLPGRAGATPGAESSLVLASVVWSPTTRTTLNFSAVQLSSANFALNGLSPTAVNAAGAAAMKAQSRSLSALDHSISESVGTVGAGVLLLDVSTNVDQFGVAFAAGNYPTPAAGAGNEAGLTITGLDLVAPTSALRVFTTPAVQWEPVTTVQNPLVQPSPFPSPAGFLDDGGPSYLIANDVTLVPVAPAPVLDEVLAAYGRGAAAAVRFTLPFGMAAAAQLPARPKFPLPWTTRAGLTTVQPSFVPQSMLGGRQLSLTAPVSLLVFNPSSPSIPGVAVQLTNLVDQGGNPLIDPRPGGQQLSVLGPDVDTVFNSEFGPGGKSPRIPVTRFDLSGYGASMFSSWVDSSAAPPTVVQVRLNVIVGRTSHEVVQVKSILYPWGAIVVRTITIDRQDDTEVTRYDSGWVAATPGRFAISGMTVHPGAVTGADNIREISDTAQKYAGPGGVELVGVYFDADMEISGVVAGAGNGLVPSTGQFGFIQTAPANTPLTAAQLAEVITANGPLGGPVDCVLAIGGTAQTMRVARVEVGNAPHPGASETNEFAAVARGSVTLPQGSWSVVSRTDTVSEPTPIDPDRGVALLRQGQAGGPAPTTPWRLAETGDLWLPDSPSMDFCLMYATDSTRVLFPRPQIAFGATAFTSDQIPLLADGFALMGATSICPRQDACLQLPDANYQLQINGAGAFTLVNVPPSFAPTMPSRILSTGSAGTIGFEYADEHGTIAQVALAISPNAWSVGLTGVNVRLDLSPFNGLLRTAGDFQATSAAGVSMQNGRLVLGSVLQPLETMFQFLEQLGMPDPLSLSFANAGSTSSTSYKLKAGITFSLPSPLIPGSKALMETPEWKIGVGLKAMFGNSPSSVNTLSTSSTQWSFSCTLNGSIQWAIVIPKVYVGGLIGFGISATFPAGNSAQSESLSFQLGVIASIGGDIVPKVIHIEGSISFSFMLIVGIAPSTSVAVGCGLAMSVSGSLLSGLLAISFGANANGLVTVTDPKSVQATFDVSVDVTVCWFLSVGFDESFQYTQSI